MQAPEVRQRFLQFFKSHGHEIVRSSSLLPHNDPSLFFVNAGMVQFKDVFTGAETRDYRRAATVQKCLRVSGKHNDLDNVGRTARHHTFFEMLGNFSFGDYFKSDAIPMAWELLTKDLGIDPNRLWVTIYEDDDEAHELWRSKVNFPEARLQRLGAKDNFWSMGDTGPCGPCTEIHYDHGPGVSSDTRGPAGGDNRYVEIWNLVFMQYEQRADGTRVSLPRPSIDTGAGLERVAAVVSGKYNNYDTELFQGIIGRAARAAGVRYGDGLESDTALRVIADHSRAAAFLVADGVMPSNEGRGYVLRRIMRRAIRFGVKLGLKKPFFHEATDQVIADFGAVYPELSERQSFIDEVIRGEEERFRSTLDRGMKLLGDHLDKAGAGGVVPGEVAFTLSDTFGFPLDLTELIAEERGVTVDKPGFDESMAAQKARGRAGWKGSGEKAVAGLWHQLSERHGPTRFSGYDRDHDHGTVVALVHQEGAELAEVDRLDEGQEGWVLLDRTPFYAESGGQVGDTGRISTFDVLDTAKASGLHLHRGVAARGAILVGDTVETQVDGGRRDDTRKNHTATHLLHAALRNVLGTHVTQKGSLVGPGRLRFDFAHHKPVTDVEIRAIEDQVNREILANRGLTTDLLSLDEAVAGGAMALFGEKYDDDVRVVSVPGFSKELCGGTHVSRTGDIGLFRIVSEGGVAAGVRRIEAQTGYGSLALVRAESAQLQAAAQALKTGAEGLLEAITRLQDDRRRLDRELSAFKQEKAAAVAGDLAGQARQLGAFKLLVAEFDGDLKEQADRLRDQLVSGVIVLAARRGARVHAGNVIQEVAPLIDGKGGGRPDLAQAGGNNAGGIAAALAKAAEIVERQLGA